MKELEFSTKLKEVPIKLDGDLFTLRELNGDARDAYMDMIADRMTVSEGKVTSITKYSGLQIKLISDSLFDAEDKNVSVETVGKFPSSVIQTLFDAAAELSDINQKDKDKDKVKND